MAQPPLRAAAVAASAPPMSGAKRVILQEEQLLLDPRRGLYWPRQKMLLVSDLHLGKGGIFRRQGVALPAGDEASDLERLSGLVADYRAERLVILGDLCHGPLRFHGGEDIALGLLSGFLVRHRQLWVGVIPGNHDRLTAVERGQLPALQWLAPGHCEAPFALCHEPLTEAHPAGHYAIAGHLHPVIELRGRGRDRLRVALFWFGQHCVVLPAFGAFTGGQRITPHPGDRLFAVGPEAVVAL